MSQRVLLLGLTSAFSLVLGFWTFTPLQAVALVREVGYWFIFASAVIFGVTLVRSLRKDLPDIVSWRRWAGPIAISLIAAGFLHLHEPHGYKIVADEVVLQLTAKQMHEAREAAVVIRGYEYAGNFTPMGTYVDKRPLFFPLLLSLVHDFTGFRTLNVHFLNAALSGVLMILLLLIGRRVAGWGAGISAVVLVATIPLVAQNATGAGFEILNMVMILMIIWLGMRYGEDPKQTDRLSAFALSGVLLAQVRYESVLFILPVGLSICYIWWRQRSVILPWPLLFCPLLLVIYPLQYNVFNLSQAAWQLNDVAGADKPFGLRYFYDNVGHAMNFFLSTDGSQGNSLLVAVAGALGVGFFTLQLYRKYAVIFREDPATAVLWIFLIGLLTHTAFMLCYFWGKWDDPIIRRLSLPAHLLLILALVVVWSSLVNHPKRWMILSVSGLVYIIGFTVPSNAMHRFTQENFAARVTNWLEGHIKNFEDRSVLAIDHNAGLQWFLFDKSSIGPITMIHRTEAFITHFRNRSFSEFIVVQRVTPDVASGSRTISFGDDFGEGMELELIEERAFAPLYLVRLSRIVAIEEEKLMDWAMERRSMNVVSVSEGPTLSPKANEDLLFWLRSLP